MSSDGGAHEWYTVDADPENANNLIVCGMMSNAKDNANYGFVYSSQDAGETWHLALEDRNSKHVHEESCAFGVHGVVYFVAHAWKEDDVGYIERPDRGTTHIWISRDSGRTWSLGTTTGVTDGSASVVDRTPGPNQNRLYVFFNGLSGYPKALGSLPPGTEYTGSTVGLISYKDGDQNVAGPIFNPEMYKQLYVGAYMHQDLMLKDGSLLALFWSKGSKETGRGSSETGAGFLFLAQHTDPKRQKLSGSVLLFRVPPGSVCDSFLTAPAAYDATTNTIYATYLDGSNGECKLMLTKSMDDGQTWAPGHVWKEVQGPDTTLEQVPPGTYRSFALARNQEGVMALLWRSSSTSSCWDFATSTDDGETYSRPMQLPSCSHIDGKYHISDNYLSFFGQNQADESKVADDAKIVIRNRYNFGENHVSGIAVSPDGVFHPVWVTSEQGRGQLRTAAIAVIKPHKEDALGAARTDGWQYKTNEVKFLYGGSQHYDAPKRVLTTSIIIRNSGTKTLTAPLRLEIDPSSKLGCIYPLDVRTEGSGQEIAQYLDIDQYLSAGELKPGANTAPIRLSFHFEANDGAKPEEESIARISIRLLDKGAN